jgi:hypothetical protein
VSLRKELDIDTNAFDRMIAVVTGLIVFVEVRELKSPSLWFHGYCKNHPVASDKDKIAIMVRTHVP